MKAASRLPASAASIRLVSGSLPATRAGYLLPPGVGDPGEGERPVAVPDGRLFHGASPGVVGEITPGQDRVVVVGFYAEHPGLRVAAGEVGCQQADVDAEDRDVPDRAPLDRLGEDGARSARTLQGRRSRDRGRSHTTWPPSSVTRTGMAAAAAGWRCSPRRTSAAISRAMVALLASPPTRAIDRLSGSEWMRRKGMLVTTCRSRVLITAPPWVWRSDRSTAWRPDRVTVTVWYCPSSPMHLRCLGVRI